MQKQDWLRHWNNSKKGWWARKSTNQSSNQNKHLKTHVTHNLAWGKTGFGSYLRLSDNKSQVQQQSNRQSGFSFSGFKFHRWWLVHYKGGIFIRAKLIQELLITMESSRLCFWMLLLILNGYIYVCLFVNKSK